MTGTAVATTVLSWKQEKASEQTVFEKSVVSLGAEGLLTREMRKPPRQSARTISQNLGPEGYFRSDCSPIASSCAADESPSGFALATGVVIGLSSGDRASPAVDDINLLRRNGHQVCKVHFKCAMFMAWFTHQKCVSRK